MTAAVTLVFLFCVVLLVLFAAVAVCVGDVDTRLKLLAGRVETLGTAHAHGEAVARGSAARLTALESADLANVRDLTRFVEAASGIDRAFGERLEVVEERQEVDRQRYDFRSGDLDRHGQRILELAGRLDALEQLKRLLTKAVYDARAHEVSATIDLPDAHAGAFHRDLDEHPYRDDEAPE